MRDESFLSPRIFHVTWRNHYPTGAQFTKAKVLRKMKILKKTTPKERKVA